MMSEYPNSPPENPPTTTCYRHPDRPAGVSCQRCGRMICPACMTAASVGFQCPNCIHESARSAPVYSAGSLPTDKPYATWALIAINAAVFLIGLVGLTDINDALFGTGGSSLYEQGVLYGPLVHTGEWWRLVTGGFLHAGLIHIGLNMFVLSRIGPQLEKLLGSVRYVALYFASLLAGALGVMVVSPLAPTLGASGAIFGLLGAAAAYQLSHQINIWRSGLGNLILINVVITFVASSYISVGGHIGGLIGGAACGYGMFQLEQRRQPAWLGVLVGAVMAVAFGGLAFAIAPSGFRLR